MGDRSKAKQKALIARCLISGVTCFMLIFLVGCKKEQKKSSAGPPAVDVVDIVQRDMPVTFEFVAQTRSSHLVNIQARVSGFLDKRVYNEGEVVKEGQVLFQIRVS